MAKKNLTLEEKLEEAIVTDGPYEVPGNWVWINLNEICKLINGDRGKNYPSKAEMVESGIPFINAGALKNGKIDIQNLNYITKDKFEVLSSGKVQKNDVLYCLRGTIGKNAYILDEMKGAIASSLCIIRSNERINKKYVFYLMNSETIIRQQNVVNNGTAQPNLSAQSVKEYKIPLSPLKEQQRIVDRIESLFEKLDKAKELIEEAREGVKNRKKMFLAMAFNGNLINKNYDLSVYLEDVLIEANSGFACSKQHELSLDEVGAYPHLRPNNVGYYNRFNFDKIVYIPNEKVQSEKSMINKGDILFNNTNSTELVGRAVVARENMKMAFSNHLTKLVVDKNKVIPEWVTYCINAMWSNGFFAQICKQWVGQSGINQNVLKKEVAIPVPPIEEQKEIVKILDKLLEEESKIEELTQLEDQIELIKKSTLAKAFRGELGTNCEEDESALELLKEILSKE
ncbi:restriction endonuclease subunit S [Clostridium beijerinckii]|uniref:restriction endonuclease subunit S n=1 Tax=Clostridium beijerinckii TaxID=1520 RepID=UPI0013610723|nr:restriction endonuclease subunit S [Clostridium beijerinckii]MZK50961.1 restriction endonuclease [Clostridium beijerinckii]MZK59163.1 restriction endonuclease [Clostridium beijerinckii]MZK69282.1 restriction endonuclease [Clostridium beijerinckii]MZK74655.1 restriction endonuclease [Clostridium beijerinckii]MZK84374.1 restriction endonuclease [Clostridium beijerinckii]